jgi:transcription antitermination factor NusG
MGLNGFNGTVEKINDEKRKLEVMGADFKENTTRAKFYAG